MPPKILCAIGILFNFICDGMLGGVSDEPALRMTGAYKLSIEPYFASFVPATPNVAL